MSTDPFFLQEWELLCQRLARCATRIGEPIQRAADFLTEADEFSNRPAPDAYSTLLQRIREAARLAIEWQRIRDGARSEEQKSPSESRDSITRNQNAIDEAVEESFPASDPPSWSPSHA